MSVRTLAAALVSVLVHVRPCFASCEEISWELRDVLRELVAVRLGQRDALEASQIDEALRRRGLPFTKPIFRFARGEAHELAEIGPQRHDLAPCEVTEIFREVPSPAGPVSVAAGLRVDSVVVAFDVEEAPAEWRVVVRVPEGVRLQSPELVVAGRGGVARSQALHRDRVVLRAIVPRGDLEAPVTMQIVAETPVGPEVVAEVRGTGKANTTEVEPRPSPSPGESLVDALNRARAHLARPHLTRRPDLQRVAERTLAEAIDGGVLAHRTAAGLLGERLKAARIAYRTSGELLARVSTRDLVVEKFFASPAHRKILGDARLRSVGVAAEKGPDGLDWVVVVMTSP